MDEQRGAAPGEEVHLETTEASGGSKEGVGRWVLVISTAIAVLILGAIALFGGLSQGDVEEEVTVSENIRSAEEDDGANDGILIENADTIESVEDGEGTFIENETEPE